MSWGNEDNLWHDQNMDSNGRKLRVVSQDEADVWAVEIESGATHRQALRVEGKLQFVDELGDEQGMIAPNADLGSLDINTKSDAPDVNIGHGSQIGTGNIVSLSGSQIFIGSTADTNWRTAIAGPVIMGTENIGSGALQVHGAVKVVSNYHGEPPVSYEDGQVKTEFLDALSANGTLNIGRDNATAVRISQSGRPVSAKLYGGLTIGGAGETNDGLVVNSGGANINGDVTMHGGTLSTGGGNITANNLTLGGQVTGNLTTQGNITAQADLVRTGAFKAAGDRVDTYLPTKVSQSTNDQVSLTVEQTSQTTTKPVLDVITNGANGSSLGIRVNAVTALDATGTVEVNGGTKLGGTLDVNGLTTHDSSVVMNGHDIVMGGTGAGEVRMRYATNRLEFLVGGTLRFYIDSSGGHNA